jgi:aspartate ammonia-lyase
MNINEVIANRALELMGHAKGEYQYCDPHDHVNASQSTNDAYPTALHVGMALGTIRLVAAIKELIASFRAKGRAFNRILKMGRTQLQRPRDSRARPRATDPLRPGDRDGVRSDEHGRLRPPAA